MMPRNVPDRPGCGASDCWICRDRPEPSYDITDDPECEGHYKLDGDCDGCDECEDEHRAEWSPAYVIRPARTPAGARLRERMGWIPGKTWVQRQPYVRFVISGPVIKRGTRYRLASERTIRLVAYLRP